MLISFLSVCIHTQTLCGSALVSSQCLDELKPLPVPIQFDSIYIRTGSSWLWRSFHVLLFWKATFLFLHQCKMMHFQCQFINDSVKGSELCWYKLMELANKHASTLAISLETLPFILTWWILYSVFHCLSYRMSQTKKRDSYLFFSDVGGRWRWERATETPQIHTESLKCDVLLWGLHCFDCESYFSISRSCIF